MVSKDEYFSALYALNEESDEDQGDIDNNGHNGMMDCPPDPTFRALLPSQTTSDVLVKRPRFAVSAVAPATSKSASVEQILQLPHSKPAERGTSFVSETPLVHRLPRPLNAARKRTFSDPSSKNESTKSELPSSASNKKRKKEPELRMAPVARRVFRNCRIFWIPNDDKNPARRIRIRKAREQGASWVTIFTPDVTHILVDECLTFDQVLDYLSLPSIPESTKVVNDAYRVDCITYGILLDANQDKYRIKGGQQKSTRTLAIHVEDPEPHPVQRSLELKPPQNKPGKWDYMPPRATPPRSETSSQIASGRRTSSTSSPGVWISDRLMISSQHNTRSDLTSCSDDEMTTTINQNNQASEDELSQIINEVKKLGHLTLDDDDLEDILVDDCDTSDDETASPSPKRGISCRKRNPAVEPFKFENFSCMKGGQGNKSAPNPNDGTIAILQAMSDIYERNNNRWRTLAYRRVISVLRQQTSKISTFESALALPYVGSRLALKIEEIVTTNRLRRLDSEVSEANDEALQLFLNIYGVGLSQASKWAAQGHKSLQDLVENVSLTQNQRIGIEHYKDFSTRIPRSEVTLLGDIVKAVASDIDPDIEIIIGGSYRRGSMDSGDIDCIITKEGTHKSIEIIGFLHQLTKRLLHDGFLVASLAFPSSQGSMWHGCCVLPQSEAKRSNPWRRIDLLLVPHAELGAALIYFTGNDIFNRSIRLLASKKNMRLNQRGLFKDVMRGANRVNVSEGELVEAANEREIFRILDVPWREPKDRIC